MAKFNATGKFCAVLDITGTLLSLWDFRVRPILANTISLLPASSEKSPSSSSSSTAMVQSFPPQSARYLCTCIEWTSTSKRLALILTQKGASKNYSKVNLQQTSELVVVDVSTASLSTVIRLGF
jgi:hypothetical protein